MGKLTYEDKINLYNDKKQGMSYKALSLKYNIRTKNAQYLYCLIERHGFDILRTSNNKEYPIYFKQVAIDRVVLNSEAIWAVSLDIGLLSDGILQNWIKKYKENGYNIVERKRGRSPMFKPKQKLNNIETQEEKIKRLEQENLYLKAELEYSKKLRAVVQARKNQQQKKK